MMDEQDLNGILSLIKQRGLSEPLVTNLRQEYKNYHFTYCIDDDMDAHSPSIQSEGFNVYYVDSSQHCSTLTKNLDAASGLVLAEVIDDE